MYVYTSSRVHVSQFQGRLLHSPSVKGDPCLGGILLQLVKGSSPEGVRTDETGLPAFPLVPVR